MLRRPHKGSRQDAHLKMHRQIVKSSRSRVKLYKASRLSRDTRVLDANSEDKN